MAWPDTSLVAEVKLELAADLTADPTTYTFATDITSLTFDRDGDSSITIRRGRQDEQSVSPPSTCDLTVDNTDGRFSPRNPVGAYYPGLRRNTPIRVRVNPGTGLTTRYVGFVSEWPPRWDVSESDFNVPVRANGVLRRLGQGATPLKSALFRSMVGAAPLAYWPMEIGPDATTVPSGLTGGVSLTPTPTLVTPGSVTATGSEPYVDFTADTNTTSGTLNPISLAGLGFTTGTKFSVGLVMTGTMPSPAVTTGWHLFDITTTGGSTSASGFECYALVYCGTSSGVVGTNYGIDVWYQSGAGSGRAFHFADINPFDGHQHSLLMTWQQVGADVVVSVSMDGVAGTSATAAGATLGAPSSIRFLYPVALTVGDVGNNTGGKLGLGHLTMWGNSTATDPYQASIGYAGEISGTRFARLCTEESVPDDVATGSTEAMGAQTTTTLLDLLRECEAAEEGLIVERANGRLGFDPHSVRENQSVALTLNYASQHVSPPLEPTDDDQRIRNDVTVTRTGGSSSTVLDQTGPVGITAVGRYDEGVNLNLYTDDQPYNHAGWRVNLGTVDGLRFPTVTVNLRRNNSLTASFLALDVGSRIKITNLPDIISYDDIDLIVEGYTERISQKNWVITFNCAPYRPYKVFVLANTSADTGEFLGRLLPDTMSLVVARDTTQTSWTVSTNPTFATDTDDYPISLRVAGEKITATAITSINDTFTRSVVDGWGSATSGQSYALIGTAADFDVSGTVGTIQPTATGSRRTAVLDTSSTDFDIQVEIAMNATPASGSNSVGVIGRYLDTNNQYFARITTDSTKVLTLTIDKRVASTATTIATVVLGTQHADGSFRTIRFRGDGTTLQAKLWKTGDPQPLDWMLTVTDTALTTGTSAGVYAINNTAVTTHIFSFDNLLVQNPVTLTVTRSVNGVVKSQLAGATIEIDEPTVLAL